MLLKKSGANRNAQLIFSHPTGNANSRAIVEALADHSRLGEFHTTVAAFEGNIWSWISKIPKCSEFSRRKYRDDLKDLTRQHPWQELWRIGAFKLGWKNLRLNEASNYSIDAVYCALDEDVANRILKAAERFDAIYGYEDGSLASFRAAHKHNLKCYYDLPIGYWRAGRVIYQEEAERKPDWAPTLTGLRDSAAKLARKDEELALADRIFVASSFTRQTLQDYPEALAPVTVIPYGFPEVSEPAGTWQPEGEKGRPLRVLFVGGLSQRKGISDLFEAVNCAGKAVELTVIGRRMGECAALDACLQQCRWLPSLPHPEVLAEMERHDVFIFPSLFEGFGLVLTEAMACGMAVITTPNTAGPDIINSGVNGYVIPIRNPEAMASLLIELHQDREKLASIRMAARQQASRRSWQAYGEEMVAALE